jgi:electron transport complex protein RnfB
LTKIGALDAPCASQACPTDAIVGSNKRMHTVMENYCTGCELCLPVCPVDCIIVENASAEATGWTAWSPAQAELARKRYAFRTARREREAEKQACEMQGAGQIKLANLAAHSQHQPTQKYWRGRRPS